MKWRRPQERLLHPGRRLLFSDAEPRENLVDDVFADGLASDFAELFPGGAQVDGDEVGGEATAYGFESGAQMVVGRAEQGGVAFAGDIAFLWRLGDASDARDGGGQFVEAALVFRGDGKDGDSG